MRNVIKAAIVALVIALATPLAAQDFDAGMEAYQRGDYTAALSEFRPLADQGLATAQTNLGIMYHDGLGVLQDFAEAIMWYEKAAIQGNVFAFYNLGLMYAKGNAVAQDVVLEQIQ
jgi:TPR repeat protein